MALFDRKSPYERLMEAYKSISPAERKKFWAEMQDLDKAEDEREIDRIEEDKADNSSKREEKAEEVAEETSQVAKDVDVAEKTAEIDTNSENMEEVDAKAQSNVPTSEKDTAKERFREQLSARETMKEEPSEEMQHEAPAIEENDMQKVLEGLNAKYTALEQKFEDFLTRFSDAGISGYGKSTINSGKMEDDRRDKLIKKFGGYA